MASEVPYTGIPDTYRPEGPRFEPTPDLNIQATPAAFGVNVAQAVEHLGEVQEGAGKELFSRALAFQQMDQNAASNAAVAEFQNRSANRYADFGTQTGKNAADGLNDYIGGLDADREDVRGSLKSPYALQQYDAESRQFRARMVFAGAVHAKDEQRKYVEGAATASLKSSQNSMELVPNDIEGNQKKIEDIKAQANHLADIGGVAPERRQQMVQESVSTGVLGQVRGLAERGQVFEAKQILNEQTAAGNIAPGPERDRAVMFINEKKVGIGVRHEVAASASGQDLSWGEAKLGDTDILNGLKGSEAGNYGFKGPDVTDKSGLTGHPLGHFGVMSYNLGPWLSEAGLPAMTEDQFRASPETQDKLALFKFKQYQDRYGTANAAAKAWFGGEGSVDTDPAKLHDVNMNGVTYLQNFNAGVARGAGLQARVDNVTGRIGTLYPDDPDKQDMIDRAQAQTEILYNQQKRITADGIFNNNETVWGAMINGVGPNKEVPKTIEELKSDPKANEAWDWLAQNDPSKLQSVVNQLVKNSRGDYQPTVDQQNQFLKLIGQSQNDAEGFMNATKDLGSMELPFSMKKQILETRGRIYRSDEGEPKIGYALKLVQDQLSAVGFTKDGDKEGLNQFTGALMDAMQTWEENHDKPMDSDQIKAATSALLAQQKGWISNTPRAEVEPTPAEAEQVRAMVPGRMMSDMEVKRTLHAYEALRAAEQYRSLYQKPLKAGVPQS